MLFLKEFQSKLFVFIFCVICVSIWLVMSVFLLPNNTNEINQKSIENKKKDYLCQIPKFNIWDKSIDEFLNKNFKKKKCVKKYKNNYYILKNGLLELNYSTLKNNTCFYACIYPKGDNSIKKGKYKKVEKSVVLDCDTFHIYCKNSNKTIFEDINFHIRNINITTQNLPNFLNENYTLPNNSKKYNVLIYVIDSLSYYQAQRGFNKSINLFKQKYEGIQFPFLNRVADNSRPNAYSFLMNKSSMNITSIFDNKHTLINDWINVDPCSVYLDETSYIINQYRKMGYVTLNAENYWYGGTFHWNNCKSFTKQQSDHTLRTFQLAKSVISSKLVNRILEEKCFENGRYLLDYLKQFYKKYKDKPHASLIWDSDTVHNNINGIFDFDIYFEKFFNENLDLFKNSFIFILADHGFRLAEYQKTKIGEFEANNPYLMVSVPSELRKNKQLIKNLKENSNRHISHMDVYATLLDILTDASKNNFENLKEFDLSSIVNFKVKGQSILRPLPIKNRNCFQLHIPIEFCLCQLNFLENSSISYEEQNNLKDVFVNEINNKITENNLTKICAQRYLNNNKMFLITKAYFKNKLIAYKVKGHVLPGNGIFSGIFNTKYKLINSQLLRLNNYGSESEKCLYEQENSKYCYCKNLLKKQ